MKETSGRKNGQVFEKMDTLKHFFEEPEREFHLRELARIMNASPSTVSNDMDYLEKRGLIISSTSRGFRILKANNENRVYRLLKIAYNSYKIRESGLIDFLNEELNNPKSIILFGSFRKGENIPGSDIDLFVETPTKKGLDLAGFEKRLGHPIQIFRFAKKDIEAMKKSNRELLNSIINGIVLEGFFEVFR